MELPFTVMRGLPDLVESASDHGLSRRNSILRNRPIRSALQSEAGLRSGTAAQIVGDMFQQRIDSLCLDAVRRTPIPPLKSHMFRAMDFARAVSKAQIDR